MKSTPVKKYEKLTTITDHSGSTILTKITDFKNSTVTFEVRNNGQKHLFKTLKEAQNHMKNPEQTAKKSAEKTQATQKPAYTQARLNF